MTEAQVAAEVVVNGQVLAQLVEVLDHVDRFFTTNQVARAELVEYCFPRPGVTAGGLVDQLAWQNLYLRTRLAETTGSTNGQEQHHD